jgi:hypothetical protein
LFLRVVEDLGDVRVIGVRNSWQVRSENDPEFSEDDGFNSAFFDGFEFLFWLNCTENN